MRCASLGRIPVVLACSRKFGSVARSSSRRKPWRRESIRHLRGRVPLRHPPCRRERCYSADSAMSSMAKRVLPAARSACDRAPLRHPWCARKRCLLGCHVGAKAFLNHERVVRSFEAWALRGSERPGSDYMSMAYVTDSAFPADELSPGREMLFEGFSFPVPARAESYLERVYGSSWRELPPIEARRNHAPIELDFGSD